MPVAGLSELRQHARGSPGCMGTAGLSREEIDSLLKAEVKRQRDRIYLIKNRDKRKDQKQATYWSDPDKERDRKRVGYWKNVEEAREKERVKQRRFRDDEGLYGPIYRYQLFITCYSIYCILGMIIF